MANVILPESWSLATVAEVNEYKSSSMQPKNYQGNTFELFSVPIFPKGKPEILKAEQIGSNKQFVMDKDVLVCKINPRINRVWRVPKRQKFDQVASSEWIVVRQQHLNSQYLTWYFRSEQFRSRLCADVTGVGGSLTRAQPKQVAKIKLPIAPLAEQKIIADKLDTLLAQVETTKARLERIPEILKTFRQSVLAAAVSGKLTEGWREENDVSIEQWLPTTVGALAEVATGKTPKRTTVQYWEGGSIPWLTSAATGKSFTYKSEQFVTKQAVIECSLKVFPAGTLLLAMYGEGKTRGQVTEIQLDSTCNQACAAILVDEAKVSKEFLKIRLQENYEETRKSAVGGAQPNLNLSKVREIPVALPTESEQFEIVRRVEELFAFADNIEAKNNTALLRVNKVTQSILEKAFRGELTADWRAANQELITGQNSTETLLEKIKEERQKLKPTRKARTKK